MQSAGMCLLLAAGAATDPPDAGGSATVLSDLILRGAGDRDSRQLTDHLDSLGLQRSSSVGVHHLRLFCAAVARNVLDALPAYADIVRRATLPAAEFGPARDLALQALAGIEDEPRQKLSIKLRERHFGWPLGRPPMGRRQDLERLTVEICRADYLQRFRARGAILSIAGNVRFQPVRDRVGQLLGDWRSGCDEPVFACDPAGEVCHETHASEQTHIGIAYPALRETDEDYYAMQLAIEVLGGGMSGRLFTEIREKRALVYNVSASYASLKDCGAILGYAGTSTDRAQATLDTFIAELLRLCHGVTPAELERARTGLKAQIVMSEESTSARASAIAHDFYMRGRVRTLDEIKAAIDAVTLEQVNTFLKNHPPGPFTIVTLGPRPLAIPAEAASRKPRAGT